MNLGVSKHCFTHYLNFFIQRQSSFCLSKVRTGSHFLLVYLFCLFYFVNPPWHISLGWSLVPARYSRPTAICRGYGTSFHAGVAVLSVRNASQQKSDRTRESGSPDDCDNEQSGDGWPVSAAVNPASLERQPLSNLRREALSGTKESSAARNSFSEIRAGDILAVTER